jgi:hypothetical protein
MSVSVPVPYCFYYCVSVYSLQSSTAVISVLFFFAQYCFGYLNPYPLLVRIQISATAMESNTDVPQNTKNRLMI